MTNRPSTTSCWLSLAIKIGAWQDTDKRWRTLAISELREPHGPKPYDPEATEAMRAGADLLEAMEGVW